MPESGYIYILMNASMPKLLKIGKTTKSPEQRAEELSVSTGVPTPYHVAFQVHVADCDYAERRVHEKLNKHRVSERREFFSAPLKLAIQILDEAEKEMPFQAEIIPKISLEDQQQLDRQAHLENQFRCCQEDALKNDLLAQYRLSILYTIGCGTGQNNEEAVRWLKIAALRGHAEAQVELGERYENGTGITKDLVESFAFYSLAARNQNNNAISKRKKLSFRMTRDEMNQGRTRISAILAQQERFPVDADRSS